MSEDYYFHGFNRIDDVPPEEFFECQECGALVTNWLKHSHWHDTARGRDV